VEVGLVEGPERLGGDVALARDREHGLGRGLVVRRLVDDELVVLAEEFVGQVATPSLVEEVAAANERFFYAFNQEGQRVYTAFSTSPRSGWTAAIGAPAHLVEAPLQRARWALIGGGAAASLGSESLYRRTLGGFAALDPTDGAPEWTHRAPFGPPWEDATDLYESSTPGDVHQLTSQTAVVDDALFVGSALGDVYAIGD
jgi:outer membrane protein assembly factor BamB